VFSKRVVLKGICNECHKKRSRPQRKHFKSN
jgi:hypothetical protein